MSEAGLQALVMVIVKISSGAGLGTGYVGKGGPRAVFQRFGFKAGPVASGPGVVVALAATALHAQRLGLVQQDAVSVTGGGPNSVGGLRSWAADACGAGGAPAAYTYLPLAIGEWAYLCASQDVASKIVVGRHVIATLPKELITAW